MINAPLFRLPSKPSSECIKLEVQHMLICIEIHNTTVGTLRKLIDKWLTQSVQNKCNSLDAFKPVFKIGFFSFILIAHLKRRIFQLWRSIIVLIWTKFIRDFLRTCTSSTIVSQNGDRVNLVILNIWWIPLHSLRWMLTTLSLSFKACSRFLWNNVLSVFPTQLALHPGQRNSYTTNDWFSDGVLS